MYDVGQTCLPHMIQYVLRNPLVLFKTKPFLTCIICGLDRGQLFGFSLDEVHIAPIPRAAAELGRLGRRERLCHAGSPVADVRTEPAALSEDSDLSRGGVLAPEGVAGVATVDELTAGLANDVGGRDGVRVDHAEIVRAISVGKKFVCMSFSSCKMK